EIRRALRHLLRPFSGGIGLNIERTNPAAGGPGGRDTSFQPFDLIDRNGRRILLVKVHPRSNNVQFSFGTGGREDWFSPVDGFSPAFGFNVVNFDSTQLNRTVVAGFTSYKFARSRAGYSFGFERSLASRVFFGAELHDLTGSDDFWRLSNTEQSL